MTDYHYLIVEPMRAALRDLAAARAKLAADSIEAQELDALMKDTDKALADICVTSANRQADRERQVQWEAIIPRCRAALDKATELERALQPASEHTILAQNARAVAEAQLAAAERNRPQPEVYPKPSELAAQRDLEAKLQAEVDTARKAWQESLDAENAVGRALVQAQRELSQLQVAEQRLRPRSERAPAWSIPSVGQLSAVP